MQVAKSRVIHENGTLAPLQVLKNLAFSTGRKNGSSWEICSWYKRPWYTSSCTSVCELLSWKQYRVKAATVRYLVHHNRRCITTSNMKTPRVAIDHNLAEIVEYLPLRHIILDLEQKQVLSKSEVEKIKQDKDTASKLLRVLKSHSVGVYLAFCNSAEDAQSTVPYKYRWLIYDMRRALDSANYTWQWLDDEMVIKESCQHFPTEMTCTLDGWKNRPDVHSCKPLKMFIINHTYRNKLIGVVNEVGNSWLHVREEIDSNSGETVVKRQKTGGVGFKTLFRKMVDDVIFAVEENGNHVGIDIRRWICKYNVPTKTGVHLPLHRFVSLLWLQDQVADAMKDMKEGKRVEKSLHVGGGVRLLLCSPFPTVHIQQYERKYKTYTEKNGIIMMYPQWLQLLDIAHKDAKLEKILPHLKYITPCYTHDSHPSLLLRMMCNECQFFTVSEQDRFSVLNAKTSHPPSAASGREETNQKEEV